MSFDYSSSSDASSLPAGSSIIGKVGIDQTTPGTTNAVSATGNVASGASDSGNPIKIAGKYNTSAPTFTNGQRADLQTDSAGNLKTNLATQLDAVNDTVSAVAKASATATGCDTYFNSALSTTVQSVKASAGTVYGFDFSNIGSSSLFVQVFDLPTGSVTLGTTTPKLSFLVPAGGGNDKTFSVPINFGQAISIAATTTSTGSGAPGTAANINFFYK